MYPSANLCRTQEAYHRDRAAVAELANVRAIATNAAIAWGEEALAAERREARNSRARMSAAITALRKREARAEQDRPFSENPDRGFESP